MCSKMIESVIKYSSVNDKENLFVSKYQLYLPSEEELKAEIEKDVGMMVDDNE